jgi:hypothetical protein
MSAATAATVPPARSLCVTAYLMTWEILLGNIRTNFDDLYKEIVGRLRQQQGQESSRRR